VPPRVGATALAVDRFGNVQLNLAPDALGRAGVQPGTPIDLELPTGRHSAVVARTFADVAPGNLVVFEDSSGNVALAVSGGNAADALAVGSGERVWIEIRSP
jgi:S-adenosyl-L-methionine hydrolase (adenosine-forming)